ncbi:hypothetical protein JZ785_22035 [Alicyclobacillus curvatus]|nr:hypothetical protein JZ785_22035 [Alicyclobacillus curvatus]
MDQNPISRYSRAYLSPFTTNLLHGRNPYVVAAWSLFAPGLGSLLQNRLFKGLILIVWSTFLNTASNINLSVWYSMTGRFEFAKAVIHTRWLLLYLAVYVYAVWDSYRGTVTFNQLAILAHREDAPLQPLVIKTLDVNFLDKRSPWLAAAWSAMAPGLGNLYLHRIISGVFFIAWTIVVLYLSHGLQAIHWTMTGRFDEAKAIVDMQWLLYIPAIYGHQMYDSYSAAVEYNKLFEEEQSKWLRDHYQERSFVMPL